MELIIGLSIAWLCVGLFSGLYGNKRFNVYPLKTKIIIFTMLGVFTFMLLIIAIDIDNDYQCLDDECDCDCDCDNGDCECDDEV